MDVRSGSAAHARRTWSFACGRFSRMLLGRMSKNVSRAFATSRYVVETRSSVSALFLAAVFELLGSRGVLVDVVEGGPDLLPVLERGLRLSVALHEVRDGLDGVVALARHRLRVTERDAQRRGCPVRH